MAWIPTDKTVRASIVRSLQILVDRVDMMLMLRKLLTGISRAELEVHAFCRTKTCWSCVKYAPLPKEFRTPREELLAQVWSVCKAARARVSDERCRVRVITGASTQHQGEVL